MTPEAQRIAIAEACGWVELSQPVAGQGAVVRKWKKKGCSHITATQLPPAYLNDLNAMHEAEKTLTNAQRNDFMCELEELLGFKSGPGGWDMDAESMWAMLNATAIHRAEAFLRTIGKWTE